MNPYSITQSGKSFLGAVSVQLADRGTVGQRGVSRKERIFEEMSALQGTASAVRTSSQRGVITTLRLGS